MDNFASFWRTYLPEAADFSLTRREEVLLSLRDRERGLSSPPGSHDSAYQDDVAQVYGLYEPLEYQVRNLAHLTRLLGAISDRPRVIVSLGCGPALSELWLATQLHEHEWILVDHSARMIARGQEIAVRCGAASRVRWICGDAAAVPGIAPSSADLVATINALHWSPRWPEWISELGRIARPRALFYVQCTYGAERSRITAGALAKELRHHFEVTAGGLLIPPILQPDGRAVIQQRLWACGQRR